ncbi:hypothetical protein HPB52_009851 [Rhipicephalus sanguineus]|uniref:Uncharacterized protein n=1 Tax=Rhipicephalus sanguineus TaxID=34632 RepID=A0A9D4PXZ7_RHISA|nr:hypothetical protein HPB52_009851 [Rhipicephalus sanguineus]
MELAYLPSHPALFGDGANVCSAPLQPPALQAPYWVGIQASLAAVLHCTTSGQDIARGLFSGNAVHNSNGVESVPKTLPTSEPPRDAHDFLAADLAIGGQTDITSTDSGAVDVSGQADFTTAPPLANVELWVQHSDDGPNRSFGPRPHRHVTLHFRDINHNDRPNQFTCNDSHGDAERRVHRNQVSRITNKAEGILANERASDVAAISALIERLLRLQKALVATLSSS